MDTELVERAKRRADRLRRVAVGGAIVAALALVVASRLHRTAPADGELAAAQRRVSFTIVQPAGLPRDITAVTIATTPTLVVPKGMSAWNTDDPSVTFSYLRQNYTTFTLWAWRYDPRVSGLRARHDRFAWRNGDQVMCALSGKGLSAAEIGRIEDAMRGTPVAENCPPVRAKQRPTI